MGLITIDIKCAKCNYIYENQILPREEATFEHRWECVVDGCDGQMQRIMSAPAIMKHSYRDGHKRSDLRDYKESLMLEADSYNLHPLDRDGHNTEIKKLRAIKK